MLFTELGIVMLVSEVHSLNAYLPISLTELGMVMLGSEVQPSNALFHMLVTELGIVKEVSFLPIAYCIKDFLFLV